MVYLLWPPFIIVCVAVSAGVTTRLQTATWLLSHEAQSLWCSASTGHLLPACRSWAVIPKCGRELWMSSGTKMHFSSWLLGFETRLTETQQRVALSCMSWFSCFSSPQALAGLRLLDHLCDGTTRHAEATGGSLVIAAQLPSWHRLLLRRPRPRPAQTQGQLPQVPDRGQRGGIGGNWILEVL